MDVAIIGSGISGLAAASELQAAGHQITLYESNSHIGGHVVTVSLPVAMKDGQSPLEVLPVEMGVFMCDPKFIHPLISTKIHEFGIELKEVPITFSFVNEKHQMSWNTQSHYSGMLKDIGILLQTIKKNIFSKELTSNVSFLLELRRFFEQIQAVCEDDNCRHMSVNDFIKKEQYSETFLDCWLLPQMLCWWGITREQAMDADIQVILNSMYLVSLTPQYILEGGWAQLIQKISMPFIDKIHLNTRVMTVSRENNRIKVTTTKDGSRFFDHVIFAVPPSVADKLLQQKIHEETEILSSFQTTTTKVYLHCDASWMPSEEAWSTVNLIQDSRGSFCTLYFGGLHPSKPDVFVTWGDQLQKCPDDSKIMHTVEFLRTLPTVPYTTSCHTIQSIQGNGGIWYCGAYVDALETSEQPVIPSLWFENSYKSGIAAAKKIEAYSPKRK